MVGQGPALRILTDLPPKASRPGLRRIVLRGLVKRCPRCGRGPLYARWTKLHRNCPECGLLYLENQGDPWFFQLVIDRGLFILPIVAGLFFGVHRSSPTLFVGLCALLVGAFLYTTPHRYGMCVALDYYARLRTGGATALEESAGEQVVDHGPSRDQQ